MTTQQDALRALEWLANSETGETVKERSPDNYTTIKAAIESYAREKVEVVSEKHLEELILQAEHDNQCSMHRVEFISMLMVKYPNGLKIVKGETK